VKNTSKVQAAGTKLGTKNDINHVNEACTGRAVMHGAMMIKNVMTGRDI
jgi:hypothetical protein